MRKLLFLSASLLISFITFSQSNGLASDTSAYIRKGVIPSFTVYKAPDSTVFTNNNVQKRKPLLLMLFSPDCGHCQEIAKEVIKNINSFKKARILMITWLPYSEMMAFYKTYKIADYSQITLAWDPKYFFVPYYHVSTYPKLIVYNKNGKFTKEFQGNIHMEEVWKAVNGK